MDCGSTGTAAVKEGKEGKEEEALLLVLPWSAEATC